MASSARLGGKTTTKKELAKPFGWRGSVGSYTRNLLVDMVDATLARQHSPRGVRVACHIDAEALIDELLPAFTQRWAGR